MRLSASVLTAPADSPVVVPCRLASVLRTDGHVEPPARPGVTFLSKRTCTVGEIEHDEQSARAAGSAQVVQRATTCVPQLRGVLATWIM